jgi:hypothetical protein
MSLSTRENTIQARETLLLARETAIAEREARVQERENRLASREKWASELHEREKLIHERERMVHEREERISRETRDREEKMDIEMYKDKQGISSSDTFDKAYEASYQSPPRRPLQESKYTPILPTNGSGNRPHFQRYETDPAAYASFPPPNQYYQYTEPITDTAPTNPTPMSPPPKSPGRLQLTAQNFLSPRRRRTTLGSPTRQANPSLSPMKSYTNLRATAEKTDMLPPRKHVSVALTREKVVGMAKLAARNTFRGRENEIVDWDREASVNPELEMPSPFIRRRGVSRISGGVTRNYTHELA